MFNLTIQRMSAQTEYESQAYLEHTLLTEETFKASDRFTEIEEEHMHDDDSGSISVVEDYN